MESRPSALIHLKGYAWLAISVCALLLFYKYVLQVYPSTITNELMRAFHVHGFGLGNLAATFFYAYFVVQLFVGVLLDRFGMRVLCTIAVLISAAGAFIFSKTSALSWVFVGRAMMGIGAAFATVTYMKVAAVWFKPRQFAFVGGLLASAVSLGAIFGDSAMTFLSDHLGWRESVFYCGIIGLVIAVLFYAIIREHPTHGRAFQTAAHPSQRQAQDAPPNHLSWRHFLSVFSKAQNWWLTVYSGLAFAPIVVFAGLYGNAFLELKYHLTKLTAASMTSMIFAGLGIGGPLFGVLADHWGRRRPFMFTGLVLSFIAIVLMVYSPVQNRFELYALAFILGLGTGAFMLGFAIGKSINPLFLSATIIAMINSGDAILGALSDPLVGKLLDLSWTGEMYRDAPVYTLHNYRMAFSVLPIYLLIAVSSLVMIRDR